MLEKVGDERFVLENLLLENKGKRHLCATPGEMGELAERTGLSICLDLSHSVITSLCMGKGPLDVFKGFLAMKPRYYHMCDGRVGEKEDMHLHLGKGNFPLREVKKMLPSGAEVCLEVPTDLEGMLKDVGFLRSL